MRTTVGLKARSATGRHTAPSRAVDSSSGMGRASEAQGGTSTSVRFCRVRSASHTCDGCGQRHCARGEPRAGTISGVKNVNSAKEWQKMVAPIWRMRALATGSGTAAAMRHAAPFEKHEYRTDGPTTLSVSCAIPGVRSAPRRARA
jgi:hypothetical protein